MRRSHERLVERSNELDTGDDLLAQPIIIGQEEVAASDLLRRLTESRLVISGFYPDEAFA